MTKKKKTSDYFSDNFVFVQNDFFHSSRDKCLTYSKTRHALFSLSLIRLCSHSPFSNSHPYRIISLHNLLGSRCPFLSVGFHSLTSLIHICSSLLTWPHEVSPSLSFKLRISYLGTMESVNSNNKKKYRISVSIPILFLQFSSFLLYFL